MFLPPIFRIWKYQVVFFSLVKKSSAGSPVIPGIFMDGLTSVTNQWADPPGRFNFVYGPPG
jgi:hypothetical protein